MAIGETFLSAFLQVLFQKLFSPGVDLFLKLVGGDNLPKILKQWKRLLSDIEALLCDAEQKQFSSKAIKLWMNDLQDLAYDLEDILDEFATEALLYKLKTEENQVNTDQPGIINNMVQSFYASGSRAADSLSALLNSINKDHSRIDEITNRLEDIQTRTQFLGLSLAHITHQELHQTFLRDPYESTSLLCEREVYGRDDKKNEIIKRLLKDEPSYDNFVVIPIVGQGGIGKTTLAQYVYNDDEIRSHFDLKAWVCVSDVFDVKHITTTIINSGSHQAGYITNLNQAHEKLMQTLANKKFLIVLDGIWSDNYDDWNQLQILFRQGAKGSRVIVTTRIENIARMMIENPSPSAIINLKALSDDDCWQLFLQHAQRNSDHDEIRSDIIKKCQGLPLAAKALGGLLRSTVEKSKRQRILDCDIWTEQSRVLPVLRSSYHHLPPHLKRIFAYGSIIPKDEEFAAEHIVLMWMAEGFLPENKDEKMEDIGHAYFIDLVSRSLYEPSPFNEGLFVMHDLIHDLAQWAAGDVCFTTETINIQVIPKRTRHLSFYKEVNFETFGTQLMVPEELCKLRTFACFEGGQIDGLSSKFSDFIQRVRGIRILALASMELEVLPDRIGDLKHLRHLDLSSTQIKELPESTSNLCNLQTLKLDGCGFLEKLPTNFRFLVNLRHLETQGTNLSGMPSGMSKLTNLQTLNSFVLPADQGSMIKELKNLKDIYYLGIVGLEIVENKEDAWEAQLQKKKCLRGFYLEWRDCTDDMDYTYQRYVLEQLRPHTSIKECELKGYRGLTFPAWLGDLSFINMVDIRLVNCDKCECLPPLGQLPLLRELWIEGMDCITQVGPEFYGSHDSSKSFPCLKSLYFHNMKSWEKWLHPTITAFPCLEKISIKYCLSLQGNLPPHFPSLKTLDIKECKELDVSLPSLPFLEELQVEGCKALLTTEDVIFCSEKMIIGNISEIIGLPMRCPYISAELSIKNYQILQRLKIGNWWKSKSMEFGESFPTCFEKCSIYICNTFVSTGERPLTLRQLNIDGCKELQSIEFNEPSFSSQLEELSIKHCKSIISIDNIPTTLRSLEIEDCQKLQSVNFQGLSNSKNDEEIPPESSDVSGERTLKTEGVIYSTGVGLTKEVVGTPPLEIPEEGERLLSVRQASRELACLTKLRIERCPHLINLLEDLHLTGLKDLQYRSCENLKSLPSHVYHYTSLQHLKIYECPKIHCFPKGGLPKNLISLDIDKVNIVQPVQEWGLNLLTSLKYLRIEDVGSSIDSVVCIPDPDLYIPSSLSELHINRFHNLKSICCSSFLNLTTISIKSCPKFESFVESLPPQLEMVHIIECDLIKQHLKWDLHGRIHTKHGRHSLR